MKKLSLISLAILTVLSQPIRANTNADQPKSTQTINLAEEQLKWQQNQHNAELKRLNQRTTFLQFENLLKSAVKNQRVFENRAIFLSLIHSLEGYPLQTDAWFAYFDNQIKSVTQNTPSTEVMALKKEIEDYIAQYPRHFLRSRLEQNILTLLNNSDSEQFVDYAKKIKPNSLVMQIAVLNEEYQLAQKSSKSKITQEAEILKGFETLWLNNGELTNDSELWQKWYANGGRTADKIYQKAEKLFGQNDVKGLALLTGELDHLDNIKEDPIILAHLQQYADLLKNPANFKSFAETLPDSEKDKIRHQFAIVQGFSRYLRTLPENRDNPDFTPYLQWAKNWQLSDAQIRDWKITFISRFFDSESPHFQQWRDAEILTLKADNLVERRLRMAIWQKTDLIPWLNALSKEGKEKQEWRYWLAKNDKQKTQAILTTLSQERGFYPMLAKAMLNPKIRGANYKFEQDTSTLDKSVLTAELEKHQSALAEIAELRQLDRLGAAKQRWRFLLENLSGESKQAKQIALSEYANQQGWFDLGVDGSIIAKAWNNIALRLPNAYQDYFDIALKKKAANNPTLAPNMPEKTFNPISKTFAMAIARQESAWNPMAQSSANARGLMQLLPNTAKATADNNQLPYQTENDLFKPFNNILLGTAHLNELNIKYPNNRILIAAAYNAGASRVERWLARAGGKLTMDEFIASIPFFETRGYVQNVLAYDFYYQTLQHKENPQTFSQEEFNRLY